MKKLVLICVSVVFMAACNKSRAPLMQAPPEKFESMELSAGETKKIEKPKVNVLIVVDNSGSMKSHQEKFKKNMDTFAKIFFANSRIDAKVAVVPVYDSKYSQPRYANDKNRRGEVRKMNPLGELVPLKNPDGSFLDSAPYITNETPNAAEVLKATVEIGVQWGPEAEESFSPVIEVVQNQKLNSEKNGNFYDKDAHLFVILLTDADDATPGYTPEEFYNFLVAAKSDEGTENGRERIHVAAAISKSELTSAPCADNGTGAVERIPEFLSFARGLKADLCSQNFGQMFAEYAQSVADKVAQQRIRLGYLPDINYSLSYGLPGSSKEERVEIPQQNYTFLPETTEIILPSNIGINLIPGGEIFIEATPVQLRNFGNGRLNTL